MRSTDAGRRAPAKPLGRAPHHSLTPNRDIRAHLPFTEPLPCRHEIPVSRGRVKLASAGPPMFLFTNAPVGTRDTAASARAASGAGSGAAAASGPVVDAIREGAQRSGVGFEYLLATAKRESALDPTAKAATSTPPTCSARGARRR